MCERFNAAAKTASRMTRSFRAYGLKIKELPSQSDAATWVDELWDMYTGFTLFSQEAGLDPKGTTGSSLFKNWYFSSSMLEG